MKDWHEPKPEPFKKQPCRLPGCDTWIRKDNVSIIYLAGNRISFASPYGHLQLVYSGVEIEVRMPDLFSKASGSMSSAMMTGLLMEISTQTVS